MIGKILSIEFVYICGTVCVPIQYLNSMVLFGLAYLERTSILKIFVSNACALTLSKFLIFANAENKSTMKGRNEKQYRTQQSTKRN